VLRSIGAHPSEVELEEIVKEVDPEGGALISFDTFLTIVAKKGGSVSSKDLLDAFKVFDLDDNGYVTGAELHEVMYNLAGLGGQLSREEIDDMIKEGDLDDDGRLNYKEFVKLIGAK